MDAEKIAGLFAKWAEREGILGRIDEAQCADLAKAFMAGYILGAKESTVLRPGSVIDVHAPGG